MESESIFENALQWFMVWTSVSLNDTKLGAFKLFFFIFTFRQSTSICGPVDKNEFWTIVLKHLNTETAVCQETNDVAANMPGSIGKNFSDLDF